MPTPSPFVQWFGSFDAWVEQEVLPGVESGALAADDMIELAAAEYDGTWNGVLVR